MSSNILPPVTSATVTLRFADGSSTWYDIADGHKLDVQVQQWTDERDLGDRLIAATSHVRIAIEATERDSDPFVTRTRIPAPNTGGQR